MFLDEPTSALDPTMVGEVLATIRALGKKGITMIIVTHEMNFARNFSDRVLFMADKGIYEDGTPDQIFDNPKGEKTIAFIRKLKHFEYHVDSKTFDRMNLQGNIATFTDRYGISVKSSWRLQLCVEELIEAIIPHADENVDMDVIAEYSELENNVTLKCKWNGIQYNPFTDDTVDNIGITILSNISTNINIDYVDGKNVISCILK